MKTLSFSDAPASVMGYSTRPLWPPVRARVVGSVRHVGPVPKQFGCCKLTRRNPCSLAASYEPTREAAITAIAKSWRQDKRPSLWAPHRGQLLTQFHGFSVEGEIVGRLLTGYANLEVGLLHCVQMVLGDLDAPLMAAFAKSRRAGVRLFRKKLCDFLTPSIDLSVNGIAERSKIAWVSKAMNHSMAICA